MSSFHAPQQPDAAADNANILIVKGDFKKEHEDDLLQRLARFGKITESNLKSSKISEGNKNKGKKIIGSGFITFAKSGSVKTLAAKGHLDFKGGLIKMKQKGVSSTQKIINILLYKQVLSLYMIIILGKLPWPG